MEKKAIIIGAASGIGRELAKIYSKNGYMLGLADINLAELETLQKEVLPDKSVIQPLDITDERAPILLEDLINALGLHR